MSGLDFDDDTASPVRGLMLTKNSILRIRGWLKERGTGYSASKFQGTELFLDLTMSESFRLLYRGYDFGAIWTCWTRVKGFSTMPDCGDELLKSKMSCIMHQSATTAFNHASALVLATYLEERNKLKGRHGRLRNDH